LRQTAAAQGVEPGRLLFAPRLAKAEHLERHRLADLFLDTFIYNAHTTASDALWAGLPVLTLRGRLFQSRVCASLLTALGLAELIARDVVEFEDLAVALARTPGRLTELRSRLGERRLAGPPFATARFARDLERAFLMMWAAYETEHVPRILWVQEDSATAMTG
jgi:predicted O-linked N-acetylglucosamine transferase (SPINDLY family)